jgi:O-antigen/teichoic acid export membrane protein
MREALLNFFRRVGKGLGLDRAIFFGALTRISSMGSGTVTLILIVIYFTPEMQGYYYTFLSLVALQVFGELGLGQVLIQFASHEWAHLRLAADGSIEGEEHAFRRLSGLIHFGLRWFAAASLLTFVGIEIAGHVIFSDSTSQIPWSLPWTALCLGVAFDLFLLPLSSILEGTNQIASIYFIRFARAVVGGMALWLSIALGTGLWAPAIGLWCGITTLVLLVFRRHGPFFSALFRHPQGRHHAWFNELWPMQWRIGLTWLSSYFYFSLFVPVLFRYQGPVPAGQMGMTWSMISSISSIPALFVETKVPTFGILIARCKWAELDSLALRVGVTAVLVQVFGTVSLLAIILWLNFEGFALAHRFLPALPLALFLIAAIVMQSMSPMAAYLRAHRREPLMWVSLAGSLSSGVVVVVLGRYFGIAGMAGGYLAVIVLSVPVSVWIFLRCRAAWHA